MAGTSSLADSIIGRIDNIQPDVIESVSAVVEGDDDIGSVIETILGEVENVGSGTPVSAIAEAFTILLSRIDELESELVELRAERDTRTLESTDEEISEFRENFLNSLRSGKIGYIRQFYNKQQFLEMKPETRKEVADCLLVYCSEINKEPSSLWKSLAVNNGFFE